MKKIITYLFLLSQAVLYIGYIIGDIFTVGQPKILKFIAVCILALFGLYAGKEKENRIVTYILFFTVIADIFFVLMNKPMFGIGVYIIIQLLHTIRLSFISNKKPLTEILKRLIPSALLLIVFFILNKPMIALISAYAVCIGINMAHIIEINLKDKSTKNICYLVGLVILVIGDIGVGLRNAQLPFITEQINHIAYVITWITYVPSLMIILSTTSAFKIKALTDKE